MSGIFEIAEGVATVATANRDAQTTSALQLIQFVSVGLPLMEAWSRQLETDQYNYFLASLKINAANPQEAADAAAKYATYSKDSTEMNLETGKQNTLVSNQQTVVRSEGDSMANVYDMEDGPLQVLRQTSSLITEF